MKQTLKLFKHPLLIFILLGTLTFFVYSEVSKIVENRNKKIYVSDARLDMLREDYYNTWSRYPNEKEMLNQINGHIMDEIFYKEAVSMGLDKSDLAVKKRLRQLIEMMLDDFTNVYASEQQLREFLTSNSEKFREEPSISFSHLYFAMDERDKAVKVLGELQNGADIEKFREYNLLMLPQDFIEQSISDIARRTGKEFADQLDKLEMQKWQGPIASVYGWHLVNIENIEPGIVPDLNDIWDIVEREWSAEQKKKRKAEQYSIMRQQYRIEFEDSKLREQDKS